MPRNIFPHLQQLLLGTRALEQPGVTATVVDIGSGLTARRAVKIEDKGETGFPTPLHQAIEQTEAFAFFLEEVFVMQRYAQRVAAGLRKEIDVRASDLVVAISPPKRGCFVGPQYPLRPCFHFA